MGVPGNWNMIFEDTFSEGFNSAVWDYKYINGDTHDDEQTQYVRSNVVTDTLGAHLLVKKETAPDGRPFTGGMLCSYPGLNVPPPAFFEAKIKTPGGIGSWPAFWLLNKDRYPPEIDIFEILNNDTIDNIHYHGNKNYDAYSGQFNMRVAPYADFHVYGLHYTQGLIEWWVDGNKVGSTTAEPINDPLYITINNTVGANGSYSGPPNVNSIFPTDMTVEYVRVWTPSNVPSPVPTPTPTPTPIPTPQPPPTPPPVTVHTPVVSIFLGIETFSWGLKDFDTAIEFCKEHGIQRIILKIYEITQGEWYQNLGGANVIVDRILSSGIDCLTYGFYYGVDPITEANAINKYTSLFGKHCLDLETDFNNDLPKLQALMTRLNSAGNLWISTWANPSEQQWSENLNFLVPYAAVFMPQCYSDTLVRNMFNEWPHTSVPIEPTFHIQNTSVQNAMSFSNFSLWEYELGVQSPALVDQFVSVSKGNIVPTYPTNSRGSIVNALQVSEFQPGHSEFECGAFAISVLGRSTEYNKPNTYSTQNLIDWAEAAYKFTTGSNTPSNVAGASIADMHTMLAKTQETDPFGIKVSTQPLHWWDTNISPNSGQSSDLATIKAAIQHGYPIIATVSEASIFDMDLGRNPYWWGPSGNHILVWVGISSDGNLLALDPANVERGDGNLQTPKTTLQWPRRYRASSVDNQWATIIKMPWLPSIPNNNPSSWPTWEPPTPPPPPPPPPVVQDQVTVIYDATNKQLIYMDTVTKMVVYRQQL